MSEDRISDLNSDTESQLQFEFEQYEHLTKAEGGGLLFEVRCRGSLSYEHLSDECVTKRTHLRTTERCIGVALQTTISTP